MDIVIDWIVGIPHAIVGWFSAINAIGFSWWMWLLVALVAGAIVILHLKREKKHFTLPPVRAGWMFFNIAVAFMALNVGVGMYIIQHPMDGPWATREDSTVDPVQIEKGGAFGAFDGLADVINGMSENLTGGLNEALAFKDQAFAFMHAINIANDFFVAALWALPLAILLLLIALYLGRRQKKRLAIEKEEADAREKLTLARRERIRDENMARLARKCNVIIIDPFTEEPAIGAGVKEVPFVDE